jgi:hypothetical protein
VAAIFFDDVAPETLGEAARVLNAVGVIDDEAGKLPDISRLGFAVQDLETALRRAGYVGGTLAYVELDPPKEGASFLIFDTAKVADEASAELHWYQNYQERWKSRVKTRVEDWISRLEQLKNNVKNWLPSQFQMKDRAPVSMREEMMRRFKVPQADMPAFDIVQGAAPIMRVQPKGLWIVGANGRVDLIRRDGSSLILVDKSEALSSHSNWEYYEPGNNRVSTKLDRESFVKLLV